MPIGPQMKSVMVRIAIVITALVGLLAVDRMPDGFYRAVVTIVTSAVIVLLWNRLHSDRSLAERRRLLAITPRFSDVGKGVIVAMFAFPWVVLCGLAVRYHVLSDSDDTAIVIFVPVGVSLLTGIALIGRACYRAFRGS